MHNEKEYLEHIIEHRVGLGGRMATFGVSALVNALERFIPLNSHNIPSEGPAIVAANHISYADTVTFNSYLIQMHRHPNILAKDSLLKIPIVGTFLKSGHIFPIHRGAESAANVPVLDAALEVLERGDVVMIYPEGSAGRGEDHWPIRGKSGLGYLALQSGAPVIPVAQWGPQDLVWRGKDNKHHVARWPFNKALVTDAGEPMTFSADQLPDGLKEYEKNQAVSDIVMGRIASQLAVLRGEEMQGYYAKHGAEATVQAL